MSATTLGLSTQAFATTGYCISISSAASALYFAAMAAAYETTCLSVASSAPALSLYASPLAVESAGIPISVPISYTPIPAYAVTMEYCSLSLAWVVLP